MRRKEIHERETGTIEEQETQGGETRNERHVEREREKDKQRNKEK